jgi:hypothetical protein
MISIFGIKCEIGITLKELETVNMLIFKEYENNSTYTFKLSNSAS